MLKRKLILIKDILRFSKMNFINLKGGYLDLKRVQGLKAEKTLFEEEEGDCN